MTASAATINVAEAPNEPTTIYDLVAVVVDSKVFNDRTTYPGLRGQFGRVLSESTFEGRVTRYVDDIVANNKLTDTKILFYDSTKETVVDVMKALENLYVNGDGSSRSNKLRGVVLIGDIPLPVVNKNGNRFISMFPYTDFVDPAYIYNPVSGDFERNEKTALPKAEIWHGIIKAPTNDVAGKQKLSEFFDKNHLYYEGVPEYANFDKKLFYGDMVDEENKANSELYKNYVKYLMDLEDLAYQRYNKYWANELTGLGSDSATAEILDSGVLTAEGAEFLSGSRDDETASGMPDIFSKYIIDQTLVKYFQVFTKFISEINDRADYTGRYATSEVDNIPGLISMKDEYTKAYLREVNGALEKKINELAEKIQEPIPILKYSKLSGTTSTGEPFKIKVGEKNIGGDITQDILVSEIAMRYGYYNEINEKYYENGVALDDLDSPKLCSVFLGSTKDNYFDLHGNFNPKREGLDGEYSILTRALRSDNPATAVPAHTTGVNTRLLAADEAYTKTGGRYSSGAIIEANDYGVPAFLPNFVVKKLSKYANPLDGALKEGDVVVKVNGKALDYAYTFDQAVEAAYQENKAALERTGASTKVGTLNIDYFRGGIQGSQSFTFTVLDTGFTALVGSQGAVMTLNAPVGLRDGEGENGLGFADQGFDQAAGCNAGTTQNDSDKCFSRVATMPVLDPAGSTALKMIDGKLKFDNRSGDDRGPFDYTDVWQIPDEYQKEDIDQLYLDSCYDGLPSVAVDSFAADSNQYGYPLDKTTKIENENDYHADFYGRWLNFIGSFVFPNGYSTDRRPSDHSLWFDLDNFDAGSVQLNQSPTITLNTFAARYGILDEIDNDGDGQVDEADEETLNPLRSIGEIGRKLLSKNGFYRVKDAYGDYQTLDVEAVPYKTISSVILHNEPTYYTITQQLKSFGTESLPIDNPRYVAFQNVNRGVSKIVYPNLFKTPNFLQMEANLDALAGQIALIPGSSKIMGGSGQYSLIEIKNKILNEYLKPPVHNTLDTPTDGIDLTSAATLKITDALKWLSLSIDDKHEYVLTYYLNSKKNAYINDDGLGYEAAYLVFNGGDDGIISSFNKDLKEETAPLFDPTSDEYQENVQDEADQAGGDDDDEDGVEIWYWLDEELLPFIEAFNNVTKDQDCCSYAAEAAEGGDDDDDDQDLQNELDSLKGSLDKTSFAAKGGQSINFKVSGFNVDNQLVQSLGTEMVEIDITQDNSAPILNLGGANKAPLIGGTATFKLSSTGNPGNAVISASSEDGLETSSFSVTATSGNVDIVSMVYYAVESEESETPPAGEEISKPVEEGENGEASEQTIPPSEVGIDTTSEAPKEQIKKSVETNAGENTTEETGGDVSGDKESANTNSKVSESSTTSDTTQNDEVKPSDGEQVEGRETWTDFFLRKQYHKKFFGQPWEQYFLEQKYPDKFSASARRLLAAIPNDQNPFVDAQTNLSSKYVLEASDEFVADGKSLMRVDAQIYNSVGSLEKDTKKVEFRLGSETGSLPTFENGNIATSVNGIATVYLKAGTKTGKFKIKGRVLEENGERDNAYPEFEKDLYLVAGEPYSIGISADSYVLVANGQSHTKVNFTIKDKFGNVANNSYTDVAIFASDNGILDEKSDLNSAIPGIEIGTTEGVGSVELYSKEQAGEINVIAVLMDSDLEQEFLDAGNNWKKIDFTKYIGNSKMFHVFDKVDLRLTLTSAQIPADGRAVTKLRTEMLHNDEVVSQYNGPIEVSVLNDNFLALVSAVPEKMISGKLHEENVKLQSTTTAGKAEVLVNVPGFISKTAIVTTLPGPAKRIELTSDYDTLYTDGDNEVILEAKLLDEHGNLVVTNNSTRINFAATQATNEMVNFVGAQTAIALKGVASAKIKGGERSGLVNITAMSPNLKVGTVTLEVKKLISPDKAEQFAPRALFVSVLGGAYSEIAQRLLHSGEAEAASTISAGGEDFKKVLYADGFGKVQAMTDEFDTKVVPATLTFPYQKIIFGDGAKKEELAAFFIVPNANSRVSLIPADQTIGNEDGIFVHPFDDSFEYAEKNGGVLIQKNDKTVAKIDKFGRIVISDKNITIDLPNKDEKDISNLTGLSFVLLNNETAFGVVNFKQSQNVTALGFDNAATSFRPGIYLKMLTADNRYEMISAFSGNSSNDPKGVYLIDRDSPSDAAQSPGFGYTSLENAGKTSGVGFERDNKQMLLFAAGNSVGESSLPYASEVGLIYGDPMVKVKKTGVLGIISTLTGYTRDIGQTIFSDGEDIQEMVKFDYNGDGRNDLLLVYESGMVRLLENVISNRHYEDRGYILNVYGGIYSAERIDANNDGYDDLVVGTKESCVEGEQCLSMFINDGGSLEREALNLAISGKAFEMKVDDLNADGCEDLVVSDSSGNIRAFYNKNDGENCGGLNTNYGFTKNFGISVDPQANLSDNLFANYAGMEQLDAGYNSTNADKFIRLTVPSETPPREAQALGFAEQGQNVQNLVLNKDDFAEKELSPQSYGKEFLFINLPKDNRMSSSVKVSTDANGGSLALGDLINYKITLKNTGSSISGLMLSDATGASMSVITDSLRCLDAGCRDDLEFVETGVSARAYVIKNISIPANGSRTIQYSVKVENLPEVHIETGKKLTDYPSHDGDAYSDILVRPAINPDGVLSYFYSTGLNTDGTVNYQLFQQQPTGGKGQLIKNKFEESDLPDPGLMTQMANALQNLADQFGLSDLAIGEDPGLSSSELESLGEQAANSVPDEVKDGTQDAYNSQTQDSNYDGCPDSYGNGFSYSGEVDLSGGLAGNVADGVEGAMSLLRCSGAGCLPIPYNYAFLVPDFAIPGLAAFATLSRPPFVASFYPSTMSDSNFRFYISPTLTGGLGFAACAGPGAPWPFAPCWTFAAPLQSTGVCPDFEGAVNDAVSQAQEYTNDESGEMSGLFSDGEQNDNSTDTTTGSVNFFDDDDPVFASATANLRIPGFPAFLTDWLDKQTEEIYNKLLDLPDLYVIYPDFVTLADQTAESFSNFEKIRTPSNGNFGEDVQGGIQSINDLLRAINSVPLIQIEGKEILIKVPAISKHEIEKYKVQAMLWLKYEEEQLRKIEEFWKCDESSENETICDKVKADMSDLINSVQKLMDDLDRIANLPREILNWRTLESKYAIQIICYMDAVMQFFGGYVKKQQRIINQWFDAVDQVLQMFKDWRLILDLLINYQATCDQCKNDRFSRLGILLQFLAVLPDPPVIPLPKWPDIVFDISQMEAGVKIVWPDVVFKPEPINLPDLPVVTLPNIIPEVELKIPGFIINIPDFRLPDLPDLPPLPFPKLPDLPKPPEIPKLPSVIIQLAINLKEIFRILCLLKLAIIPVPEWALETEIETLTQPNVDIVLQIIAKLAIQLPPIQYDYVSAVKISAKTKFELDTGFIYKIVKSGADAWNGDLEKWVESINKYTEFDLQALVDNYTQALFSRLMGNFGEVFGLCLDKAENSEDENTIRSCVDEAVESCRDSAGQTSAGVDDMCYSRGKTMLQEKNLSPTVEPEANTLESQKSGKTEDSVKDYSKYYDDGSGSPAGGDTLTEDEAEKIKDYGAFLDKFDKELSDYIANMDKQDLPDKYYLKAETVYLNQDDPLLNRDLSEVKKNNVAFDDMPELERWKTLRDGLIAYTENLDKTNDLLEQIDDFNEFGKVLAENDESLKKVASLGFESGSGVIEKELKTSFFGSAIENEVIELDTSKLIAASDQTDSFDQSQSGNQPVAAPKGLFVLVDGENENVLSYTAELGRTTHLLFDDSDEDEDSDIIYSLGGDVYFKENYKNDPDYGRGSVLPLNGRNKISDYSKNISRVNNVISTDINNGKADLNFAPSYDGVSEYEIVLRRSLLEEIENPFMTISVPAEEISNPDNPSWTVEIENGNYLVNVFAVDANGNRSLTSESTVISPQKCADNEQPMPIVSSSEKDFKVPIFKELLIDAGKSFDSESRVVKFYLEDTLNARIIWSDLNPIVDSNGDGLPMNDSDNPIFRMGPYQDIGDYEYVLHVVDESGNEGTQNLSVEVYTPKISLDTALERNGIVSGATDPKTIGIPLSIIRQRYLYRVVDGKLSLIPKTEKVTSQTADIHGKYFTLTDGSYKIEDLKQSDMILVQDKNGSNVFEINSKTGNVSGLKNGYKVLVVAAVPPISPSYLSLVDNAGKELGRVYTVPDPNEDVKVNQKFEKDDSGVYVNEGGDGNFALQNFPGDNPIYPGGAVLVKTDENDKQLVVVDTAGNIIILDSRIRLAKKLNNQVVDPMLIQVMFEEKVVAEIYVSPLKGGERGIIVGPDDVPFASPRIPQDSSLYGLETGIFKDVNPEDSAAINDLFKKGIIEGVQTPEGLEFKPEDLVTRAEFVKVLLGMICVIPREPEAFTKYSAEEGGGYYDIEFSEKDLAWYYQFVKEATLLGLVEGYEGEADADGSTPFKPENHVTRAEATKVILEALEMKGAIDLSELKAGEPWYDPYMGAAKDLTPYLKDGVILQNNFIITDEEAEGPNEEITREDLVIMAERVLDIYNCFEIDDDGNGTADFCQEKYGFDDPLKDMDADDLSNGDECFYGTDPTDKDTDKGGALDGAEFKYGTNMLNPVDDPLDDDGDGLTNGAETLIYKSDPKNPDTDGGGVWDGDEVKKNLTNPLVDNDDSQQNVYKEAETGLYFVPANCSTCPCEATFLPKGDVNSGDVFFTIISTNDESKIFSKSNEVIFK